MPTAGVVIAGGYYLRGKLKRTMSVPAIKGQTSVCPVHLVYNK